MSNNEALVPSGSTRVYEREPARIRRTSNREDFTMLETELFAFLEQTADAAYTVTEQGEIGRASCRERV